MAQLDVQQIAVATNTDHIRLFDMNDWTCKLLDGHKGLVTCVDAYADRLISGSADMNAKLWENGICVATCTGHAEPITAVALRSTFAITASADRTIKCWNLQTLSQPSTYYTFQAHEKTINALDISPCGKFFASSGQDGLAKVWAVEDGTGVSIMKGHKRGVWCVKYSSGGKLLATGGADKTVRIWNPMSGECLKVKGHLCPPQSNYLTPRCRPSRVTPILFYLFRSCPEIYNASQPRVIPWSRYGPYRLKNA